MATKKAAPGGKGNTKAKAGKAGAEAARTPAAAARAVPTAQALAGFLGAAITPRLTTPQMNALVKAPPGYVNVLDDAADQYEIDEATLRVKDVSPGELRALKVQQKALAKREAVAYEVHRSLYEQRLAVDSQAMKMLQAIGRRVAALRSDHPELGVDWKSVLDFLAQYHPGRPKKAAAAQGQAAQTGQAAPGDPAKTTT